MRSIDANGSWIYGYTRRDKMRNDNIFAKVG